MFRWSGLLLFTLLALPSADHTVSSAPGSPYVVNTTSDTVVAGACDNNTAGCSLRGAIEAANVDVAYAAIQFDIPASDPKCIGGVCTIDLADKLPNLSTDMEITGPGADRLTVRTSSTRKIRIFSITATTTTVTLSGLTISNARSGGVSSFSSGTVNVLSCTVSGNGDGSTKGAGIFNGAGTLNVTNSIVADNLAGDLGGGIYGQGGGSKINITNSTIIHNHVVPADVIAGAGGGIANSDGTVSITNSTITGNSAEGSGGGIDGGSINITNSRSVETPP